MEDTHSPTSAYYPADIYIPVLPLPLRLCYQCVVVGLYGEYTPARLLSPLAAKLITPVPAIPSCLPSYILLSFLPSFSFFRVLLLCLLPSTCFFCFCLPAAFFCCFLSLLCFFCCLLLSSAATAAAIAAAVPLFVQSPLPWHMLV